MISAAVPNGRGVSRSEADCRHPDEFLAGGMDPGSGPEGAEDDLAGCRSLSRLERPTRPSETKPLPYRNEGPATHLYFPSELRVLAADPVLRLAF